LRISRALRLFCVLEAQIQQQVIPSKICSSVYKAVYDESSLGQSIRRKHDYSEDWVTRMIDRGWIEDLNFTKTRDDWWKREALRKDVVDKYW